MPICALQRLITVAYLGATLAGCASALPRYPHMPARQALTILRERAEGVRTFSTTCRIILERPDGRSIQLEGAIAARAPEHLRIRGWKASQAVLDLTLRPDGLWLYQAQGAGPVDEPVIDRLTAGRVAEGWSLITGGFRDPAWSVGDDSDGSTLRFLRRHDSMRAVCEVTRSTLTLYRCELLTDEGEPRMTLMLDGHRAFGSLVWPTRIRSISPSGMVTVLVDDPVFNADLPRRAFDPPRRAARLP